MDTLESMRAFVRVVELGSFAGAARSLHMSPAMVTKHVVNLEERTGARLLHRTTRQVRLTDTGQVYFERCVTLLGEVEAAEAEAGADVSEPRGVLKITVPVEFGNPYLSPIISEFIELYPKIDLDLHFTNRVVNIMEDGFDIAIRIAESFDTTLLGRRLAASNFHIVASPGYIEKRGRPETPEDLADHTCLSFSTPRPWDEWRFTRSGETKLIKVKNKLLSTSSEALRMAARSGAGISWLPTFVVGEDFAERRSHFPLSDLQHRHAPDLRAAPPSTICTHESLLFSEFSSDPLEPAQRRRSLGAVGIAERTSRSDRSRSDEKRLPAINPYRCPGYVP